MLEKVIAYLSNLSVLCRTSKNKTVTTAADVLATSVSAEALLLSPTVIGGGRREAMDSLSRGCSATTVLMVAEVASSPMSPITLTSVEINEVNPQISTAAAAPLAAMEAMSHMEATEATLRALKASAVGDRVGEPDPREETEAGELRRTRGILLE